MDRSPTRILLIEDDEDDYILVKSLLPGMGKSTYVLDWESSYETGLKEVCLNLHDVYLLDYRLGERTGLDLLREVMKKGCVAPIIFLTGQGDYEVDIEAMKAGAVDYLVKDQIDAPLLERAIRYAIDRKRTEDALRQSERQLRDLSSQLITAQESERKRIARDLHDGLAQLLTAAKFTAENAILMLRNGKQVDWDKTLGTLIPMIQKGIKEVGRISTDLWPSFLTDVGLLAAIEKFCREFEMVYPGIRFKNEIDLQEEDVPDPLKINLYRIIQEAANNSAKHSEADLISLSLKKRENRIQLIFRDNGQGFDLKGVISSDRSRRGMGLSSMRERAELSGGSFAIETASGAGTVIRASWPILE